MLPGQKVRRIGSAEDYATGRTGEIVTAQEAKDNYGQPTIRFQVRWTEERDGRPIRDGKGVKTWVNQRFLEKVVA